MRTTMTLWMGLPVKSAGMSGFDDKMAQNLALVGGVFLYTSIFVLVALCPCIVSRINPRGIDMLDTCSCSMARNLKHVI